jgi:molybdenum cofactor cytidylyltransferase
MRLASLQLFSNSDQIAWVGAGGKTSLMFSIAKELFADKCVISTTTKLAYSEMELADRPLKPDNFDNFDVDQIKGVSIIYRGLVENEKEKITGFEDDELLKLSAILHHHQIPLMIEADGSKRKPCKFPALHEPNIPKFVNKVCVVIGLSAIGKPLTDEFFHRPEKIAKVLNISMGEEITTDHIFTLLSHPNGGLKNIPGRADKYLFLHQADSLENPHQVDQLASALTGFFDHVLLSEIRENKLEIGAHWGKIGCVILAAGSGSRFGGPKQLAVYQDKTFIENVIETAQSINFQKRVIILGSYFDEVLPVVNQYQIEVINNQNWRTGQSTSVKMGVGYFKDQSVDAVLFLLVDQPQITPSMVNNVLNLFAHQKEDIIVHSYNNQYRHPILFSKNTFQDLMSIQGDQGGRQLFEQYSPRKINLVNDYLAMDVDTVDDLKDLSANK